MKSFIINNKEKIVNGLVGVCDLWIGAWKKVVKMCFLFLNCYAIFSLCKFYPESEIVECLKMDYDIGTVYILFQMTMNIYLAIYGCIYIGQGVLKNKYGWYKFGELIVGYSILQISLTMHRYSILELIMAMLIYYTINYFVLSICFKITKLSSRNIGDNSIVSFSYFVTEKGEGSGLRRYFLKQHRYEYETNMSELTELYHKVHMKKDKDHKDSKEKREENMLEKGKDF